MAPPGVAAGSDVDAEMVRFRQRRHVAERVDAEDANDAVSTADEQVLVSEGEAVRSRRLNTRQATGCTQPTSEHTTGYRLYAADV